MVVHSENHTGPGADEAPAAFATALEQLRAATLRHEVFCEEMPAPQRVAPWSGAISADVTFQDEEVATGRLILLHEPRGNDAWDGPCRLIAYARAHIDPELAVDPLLGGVGWTWLTDALDAHGSSWDSASGSVTRVATESFGGMADEEPTA